MGKTLALAIPAFNAAWCLPRLLDSAKLQSIPFDEILVYNDYSTDDTAEIVKNYGAILVNGTSNMGCSFGKNKLTTVTKCDFIHFHDADDELLENFTTLAHRWMQKHDCPDVVLFDFEYRINGTKELISTSDFNRKALKADPIRYSILNQINPFCGLYKTNRLIAVNGYDLFPEILYNEDVAFHCKLAINGFTFDAEKEISIINYEVGKSMSSANELKCAQAHFHVMKINAEKTGGKYGNEIAKKLWRNAAILANKADWETANKAVDLAIKMNGRMPKHENFLFKVLVFLFGKKAIVIRAHLIKVLKRKK